MQKKKPKHFGDIMVWNQLGLGYNFVKYSFLQFSGWESTEAVCQQARLMNKTCFWQKYQLGCKKKSQF